ncbi:DUF4118 domain-containing protein [Dactylosporangium darangshiense]
MLTRLAARLVRPTPPPLALGLVVGALLLVVETLLVYLLGRTTSRHALVEIFLLGVLAISMVWGLRLAVAMAVVSAAAFNIFYVPPVRKFDLEETREWVGLAAFLVVAVLAALMAQLARARAVESVERRQEADLFARLARLMLSADDLRPVLPEASRRLAQTLRLPFAAIELDSVPDPERRAALPLRYGSRTGALLVPADLPEPVLRRVRERVLPRLEILLRVATEREATGRSLRELATTQASLRRVAELVAHGAPQADVVAAVAAETASLLAADAARLVRHEVRGTVSVIADYNKPGIEPLLGRVFAVDGGVTQQVLCTSRPARVDSYDGRRGALADAARKLGFHSSVAAPITVASCHSASNSARPRSWCRASSRSSRRGSAGRPKVWERRSRTCRGSRGASTRPSSPRVASCPR